MSRYATCKGLFFALWDAIMYLSVMIAEWHDLPFSSLVVHLVLGGILLPLHPIFLSLFSWILHTRAEKTAPFFFWPPSKIKKNPPGVKSPKGPRTTRFYCSKQKPFWLWFFWATLTPGWGLMSVSLNIASKICLKKRFACPKIKLWLYHMLLPSRMTYFNRILLKQIGVRNLAANSGQFRCILDGFRTKNWKQKKNFWGTLWSLHKTCRLNPATETTWPNVLEQKLSE